MNPQAAQPAQPVQPPAPLPPSMPPQMPSLVSPDQVTKQSTIDRLAQAQNVLVTVSANPSVDQLAAAIGWTLFLNKQGKHATAVFSGQVPSALEFLHPDKTIEKNTDSLRDFIISLDKAKADKLRYKVENNVVRIFITPYRTSLSDKDFEFSQGDFNVDVVIALGVHTKEELDQAIIAHGRILHDATVISINNATAGSLGTINWQDQQASSLCEMLVELAESIKADSFDAQMATAFLTGIVAETKRFSNEKTTSRTMSLSAKLMAAGANQQLVATQLQSKSTISQSTGEKSEEMADDGTLEIDHTPKEEKKDLEAQTMLPEPQARPEPDSPISDVRPETGNDNASGLFEPPKTTPPSSQPTGPSRGGTLTANTKPEGLSPAVDPLTQTSNQPMMQRGTPGVIAQTPAENDLGKQTISNIEQTVLDQDKTLADIEQSVGSPKAAMNPVDPAAGLDSARAAVEAVAEEAPSPLQRTGTSMPMQVNPAQSPIPPDPGLPPEQTGVNSAPTAAPPVPPPLVPMTPQPPSGQVPPAS